MTKVSTLQKLGAVARVAGKQAGRNRTLKAAATGAKAALRSLGGTAHQLWLEVTGTLFLTVALFGGGAAVREYIKLQAGQATVSRVALAAGFTLIFAWFGVSSFSRARKRQANR